MSPKSWEAHAARIAREEQGEGGLKSLEHLSFR